MKTANDVVVDVRGDHTTTVTQQGRSSRHLKTVSKAGLLEVKGILAAIFLHFYA